MDNHKFNLIRDYSDFLAFIKLTRVNLEHSSTYFVVNKTRITKFS